MGRGHHKTYSHSRIPYFRVLPRALNSPRHHLDSGDLDNGHFIHAYLVNSTMIEKTQIITPTKTVTRAFALVVDIDFDIPSFFQL